MEPPQYPPGTQLPGTVYRVVRHLATGGMGSVYDVEDVTVGKRYVLKTLHPQLISRHDLKKRMEAEARTLAKLSHPNIVDVVTAGLTTDERPMPFYVMERLNGQNLRVVIEKKGALELTHCLRIAIDVLDALEHAHEHGVIHRDVKPDNIFLHRNTNGTTITKLLDFGIMRLLDRKTSDTQGKFIGTLRYASPEQVFGGELGPATDIYSLGMVLYEMLAGRGPFDEISEPYAVGMAHAHKPPPPLSTFVPVPIAVERLVASSLAKGPEGRPRDCFTFASELRQLLRHEEAIPKSGTAVNALSSAPPPSEGHEPLAGLLRSQETSELEGAPTVASDAGAAPPARAVSAPARTGPVTPAPDFSPPAFAATSHARAEDPAVDMGPRTPTLPDELVRAALAKPQPLVVSPSGTGPGVGNPGEIVFPPSRSVQPSGTGPLGAEARTRPPERGVLVPILAAVAVCAVVAAGVVVVRHNRTIAERTEAGKIPLTHDDRGSSTAPSAVVASAGSPSSSASPATATAAQAAAAGRAAERVELSPVSSGGAPSSAGPSEGAGASALGAKRDGSARGGPPATAAGSRPRAAPVIANGNGGSAGVQSGAQSATTSPPPARKSPKPSGTPSPRPEDVQFE